MSLDIPEIKRELQDIAIFVDDLEIRQEILAVLPLLDETEQQIKTLISERDRLRRGLNRLNPFGDITSWKGDDND